MVRANCLKNCPLMPAMNAVGTNTAHEHQRDGDDRPGDFVHRLAGRVARRQALRPASRSTFSTTTIASSTTMPIASTSPNSDRLFSEKPEQRHDRERADQRHRHGDHRDDRRPPVLQEHQHDDEDQDERFDQRVIDAGDRFLDEDRRVVDDAVIDALREAAPSAPPSSP